MSMELHIADAEKKFVVVNILPDCCRVGKDIIPFDIVSELPTEQADYAKTVFARSEAVLMVKSIINGVKGNAGSGVKSGVAQKGGNAKVIEGSATVFVESRCAARHNDLCEMNGKVSGSA